MKRQFEYDPLMRLETITALDPKKKVIQEYQYQYDLSDNITTKKTEHGDYEYEYDPLYRVISTDNPDFEDETFSYDAVGNRTSDNKTEELTYNGNNELLSSGSIEITSGGGLTIQEILGSVKEEKSPDYPKYFMKPYLINDI